MTFRLIKNYELRKHPRPTCMGFNNRGGCINTPEIVEILITERTLDGYNYFFPTIKQFYCERHSPIHRSDLEGVEAKVASGTSPKAKIEKNSDPQDRKLVHPHKPKDVPIEEDEEYTLNIAALQGTFNPRVGNPKYDFRCLY